MREVAFRMNGPPKLQPGPAMAGFAGEKATGVADAADVGQVSEDGFVEEGLLEGEHVEEAEELVIQSYWGQFNARFSVVGFTRLERRGRRGGVLAGASFAEEDDGAVIVIAVFWNQLGGGLFDDSLVHVLSAQCEDSVFAFHLVFEYPHDAILPCTISSRTRF